MSIVDTQIGTNIKNVLKKQPRNTVITILGLQKLGLSREQIRSIVNSGWLHRLGSGAYTLLEDAISLDGALFSLQNDYQLSIHEGGYTALANHHGVAHNLVSGRKSQLFSVRGEKVPAWFLSHFGKDVARYAVSIFDPQKGVFSVDAGGITVAVSNPERAILEMLYLTPEFHTLQETYQIMEMLVALRPTEVQQLLESTRSFKIRRLFLYMAEKAGHTWLKRLAMENIPLGSGDREITKGGVYDKKYRLVIGDLSSI